MALPTVFILSSTLGLSCNAQRAEQAQNSGPAKKPDSGKFVLTIQGTRAGTVNFKFDADGGSEADASVDMRGQSQAFKISVKAKAGKVTGVGANAGPTNHFSAQIAGNKAEVRINDGPPQTQAIPAGALPFGNVSPHLMNYVLGAYDAKKGGTQTFNLLLIEALPGGQFVSFPGKLTAKGSRPVTIAGKPVTVTTYTLAVDAGGTEIEMTQYADADRRLLAWKVPSQQYTAVREGYEDVLKRASP